MHALTTAPELLGRISSGQNSLTLRGPCFLIGERRILSPTLRTCRWVWLFCTRFSKRANLFWIDVCRFERRRAHTWIFHRSHRWSWLEDYPDLRHPRFCAQANWGRPSVLTGFKMHLNAKVPYSTIDIHLVSCKSDGSLWSTCGPSSTVRDIPISKYSNSTWVIIERKVGLILFIKVVITNAAPKTRTDPSFCVHCTLLDFSWWSQVTLSN